MRVYSAKASRVHVGPGSQGRYSEAREGLTCFRGHPSRGAAGGVWQQTELVTAPIESDRDRDREHVLPFRRTSVVIYRFTRTAAFEA